MSFRTIPASNYILPSCPQMREVAEKMEVRKFSLMLVEDLCALASGGELALPSQYSQDVRALAESNLEKASDGDYKYRERWLKDDDNDYVSDYDRARQLATQKELNYHRRVQDFLQSLDLSKALGDTPLEKAMGILKLLASYQGGSSSGDDSDIFPIFGEGDERDVSPTEVALRLMEAIEQVESLSDAETELLGTEGMSKLDLAEDMLEGKEHILKISRSLDRLVKFRVSRVNKYETDPEGDETRYRPMRDLSEISRLHPTEWVYPKLYRNYRMAAGQSMVRERVTRIERKQDLTLLIDCSGSMNSDNRFFKAGGVLMNRLKAVVSGDAELTVHFFDTSLRKELEALTLTEAKALMKEIKEHNFSGGGTAIASCTKKAVGLINDRLERNPHLCKPELVVVTDGDDNTSGLTLEDLRGIRLHAFLVGGKNSHLTDLARRSGGVGIDAL